MGLVKRLAGATPYEHATVVAALRPGGEAGVVALVVALANAKSPEEQSALRKALVQLGTISTAPLMAVLSSRQPALLASVIDVLAALEDPTTADRLLAPALAPDSPAEIAAAARGPGPLLLAPADRARGRRAAATRWPARRSIWCAIPSGSRRPAPIRAPGLAMG